MTEGGAGLTPPDDVLAGQGSSSSKLNGDANGHRASLVSLGTIGVHDQGGQATSAVSTTRRSSRSSASSQQEKRPGLIEVRVVRLSDERRLSDEWSMIVTDSRTRSLRGSISRGKSGPPVMTSEPQASRHDQKNTIEVPEDRRWSALSSHHPVSHYSTQITGMSALSSGTKERRAQRVTFGFRHSIVSGPPGQAPRQTSRRISAYEEEKRHKKVLELMEEKRMLRAELDAEDDASDRGDHEHDPEEMPRGRGRSGAMDEDAFEAEVAEALNPRPRARSCGRLEDYNEDLGYGEVGVTGGRRLRGTTDYAIAYEGLLLPDDEDEAPRGRARSRTNDFGAEESPSSAPSDDSQFRPRPRSRTENDQSLEALVEASERPGADEALDVGRPRPRSRTEADLSLEALVEASGRDGADASLDVGRPRPRARTEADMCLDASLEAEGRARSPLRA